MKESHQMSYFEYERAEMASIQEEYAHLEEEDLEDPLDFVDDEAD